MALALFDLDDTLLDGDSATLWFRFMVSNGIAEASMLAQEEQMMARYYAGQLDMAEYMTFTLQPLAGKRVNEVNAWAREFVGSTIPQRFFSEGLAQLARHRALGDRIVIISASGEHIVRPIAELLGVADVLAIELAQEVGCYTGQTRGVLSFREGKVTRLMSWMDEQGESLAASCGYSDSINDLPMLKQVAQPHVVNPAPELLTLAQQQGWPILNWQRIRATHSPLEY
ncbi:MAG: HAD family hydrolase [Aeromonadaceae bacterium]